MAQLERKTLPKSALIVKFLPEDTTVDELHFLFRPFGEITRVNFVQDFKVGGHNGFVEFACRVDAELAMDELDGVETVEGRKLRIDWTKDSASWGYDLQVRNLDPEADSKALKEMFQRFGEVTRAEVSYNWTTGKSNRCGYVRFATHVEATAASRHYGGHITQRGIYVVYLPSGTETLDESADASEPVVLTWKSSHDSDSETENGDEGGQRPTSDDRAVSVDGGWNCPR